MSQKGHEALGFLEKIMAKCHSYKDKKLKVSGMGLLILHIKVNVLNRQIFTF